MKKSYLILASSAMILAGCANEEYLGAGENPENHQSNTGEILFSSRGTMTTRGGESFGATAAEKLGGNFIVEGTKGATATDATTSSVVFDNYLVVFGENTANTTASNTNNWEYVGKTEADGKPEAGLFGAEKLNRGAKDQSIKYWDYSQEQYDFVAYSTGSKTMIKGTPSDGNSVRVTLIDAANKGYTFEATTADALTQCYVSDIATVAKGNFGEPVTLHFKNLGAKIRLGIYETVPGYSVRDVEFYTDGTTNYKYVKETGTISKKSVFAEDAYNTTPEKVHSAGDDYVIDTWYQSDGTTEITNPSKEVLTKLYYDETGSTPYAIGTDYNSGTEYYNRLSNTVNTATLYGSDMPESGTVVVTYPVVGSAHTTEEAYNEPSVTVTAGTEKSPKKDFGTLANLNAKYSNEKTSGEVFIGKTSITATFAGEVNNGYYQNVVPNPTGNALTLRVNYTLESTDGSGESIKVWGAKAIVPAIYAQWQPNYAYTYLFKISDNTNGSTEGIEGTTTGLFPITFDAVVAEYTSVSGEQTTITTVAAPSITTYQKGHVYTDASTEGEYLASKGAIYVMVKDGNGARKNNLGTAGKLYTVSTTGTTISEATVNDALAMQKSETSGTIVGRNGITLTPADPAADATITKVVGCDGKEITVVGGEAAKFTPAAGKYAYVYTATAAANTYMKFQPVTKAEDADVEGLFPLAYTAIEAVKTTNVTGAGATAAGDKAYFSVTTVGSTPTYTYVSTVVGKPVAEGLVWVDMSSVAAGTSGAKAVADTFYFEKYKQNDGVYGVKVINVK